MLSFLANIKIALQTQICNSHWLENGYDLHQNFLGHFFFISHVISGLGASTVFSRKFELSGWLL